MTDQNRDMFIDLAIKIALQKLTRTALQRLVVATGPGGLDEIEDEVTLYLKNKRFPGAPIDFEPEMVEIGLAFITTLISEARGDGVIEILD